MFVFFILEGHFGDIIGCRTNNNDNLTHRINNNSQTFENDIMCIDYCLKLSVSFAGKLAQFLQD